MSVPEEHWLILQFQRVSMLFAPFFAVWTRFLKMGLMVRIFTRFRYGRKSWRLFVS